MLALPEQTLEVVNSCSRARRTKRYRIRRNNLHRGPLRRIYARRGAVQLGASRLRRRVKNPWITSFLRRAPSAINLAVLRARWVYSRQIGNRYVDRGEGATPRMPCNAARLHCVWIKHKRVFLHSLVVQARRNEVRVALSTFYHTVGLPTARPTVVDKYKKAYVGDHEDVTSRVIFPAVYRCYFACDMSPSHA